MNDPEQEDHYTEQEARALVGKVYESLIEFASVPKGTRGRVVQADNGGLGHWDVVIEWDLPRQAPSAGTMDIGGEHVLVIQTNKPLRDWFSKSEMAQAMREVS